MKKFVLDTSVIVKWFVEEEGRDKAMEYLFLLKREKIKIYLPELAKYELGNVVSVSKRLPEKFVMGVLERFYKLPLIFVKETFPLAVQTYNYVKKYNITYYDASFISLSKLLEAKLVTANPKHQAIIKDINVEVI